MILEHLEVSGVRNLEKISLDLCPGLNVFDGPNGSGKTALLESVYLLGRGKSFRTNRIGSIVNHALPVLLVYGRFRDPERGIVTLGVSRNAQGAAQFSINGTRTHRTSELARLLPLQLLLPDASGLVFGSPGERRRFLDWGVFHVKPHYLDQWREYQQALKQRNGLLKQIASQSLGRLGDQLSIWNDRLARLGEAVDRNRRQYLTYFYTHATELFAALDTPAGISIDYHPGWKGERLAIALDEHLERDIRLGNTWPGPHRADLHITLAGREAAASLSRGQAKMLAHGLYLSRALVLEKVTGRKSLFLIDDMASELDERHGDVLFELLCQLEFQVLANATQVPGIGTAYPGNRRKMFHVKQGSVS